MKKKMLLENIDTQEEFLIAFNRTLAIVCIIIKDLAFFLIWSVDCICL